MIFKSITPANEPSTIDRVTKDLFGAKKSRLNNAQTGIFLGRTRPEPRTRPMPRLRLRLKHLKYPEVVVENNWSFSGPKKRV